MQMKPQTRTMTPLFLILVTIMSTSTQALEVEFSYIEGSEKGPSRWGDLKPEWAACNKGTMQSPIDLVTSTAKVVPNSVDLNDAYKPVTASILNRGHYIMVNWEVDAGSITIDGTHFSLRGAHWHSPSEHLIDGKRYDLELHMVHQFTQPDGTNKTAVFAALYMLARPDPFLSKLEESIKEIGGEGEQKSVGVINPSDIGMGRGHSYYRYTGSLTTPPCTEGVIWSISNQIRTVSRDQLNLLVNSLQSDAKRNARPVQALSNREIQFRIPKAQKHE